MDKRAWVKIVEAFVAIMFIAMILLVLVNKGGFKRNDNAERIYEIELSILREIQTNTELRADVLAVESTPVMWDDPDFPLSIKNKILSRLPNYLDCEAKICALNETCSLEKAIKQDIYAQAIAITVNVGTDPFNPRQLRLFCWTGLAPEPEYPEGTTCKEIGGDICEIDEICPGVFFSATDTDICCNQTCEEELETCEELSGDICIGTEICTGIILLESSDENCCNQTCELPQAAILTLVFSETIYELKNNVNIEGIIYPKVHYYNHTRTFTESNGVGVNLTQGQLCYTSLGTCDSSTLVPPYRIDGGEIVLQENKQFWTASNSDVFNLSYWGEDDNEYSISISQYMCVNEASFTENCVV
ncbi:MAG: hypothetical protein KJ646_03880 [Nanoarchaeota archaeon]|nr:hypothetical protein [Nanoarchaeota archaeon]MBU4116139.1 hypothetical protein [Nanoarchaeota archaeon]